MKRLYSLSMIGSPLGTVIGQLISVTNEILAGRNFQYKDTVIGHEQINGIQGYKIVTHVTMIFEADAVAVEALEKDFRENPEFRKYSHPNDVYPLK